MFKGETVGRKSNKQLIEDQLNGAITIGQLIEHLKTLSPDIFIGKVGHFGEAHLMSKYNFSYIRRSYITPSESWRDDNEHHIDILDVSVPNIGPNPD